MQTKLSIIAHRGFSSKAPENTMSAFEQAFKLGVDAIELDIHLTADQKLVAIHDDTLERTTSGKGSVRSCSSIYVKNLDAGSWFDEKYAAEKVPMLADVIDWAKGRIKLLIEIKGKLEQDAGLPKLLINTIRQFKAEEWCEIQSFDKGFLINAYSLAPELPYYLLIDEDEKLPTSHEAFLTGVNPSFTSLTPGWIDDIKEAERKTFAYTVNNREDMQQMISMGVDGIITDFPDILKQLKNDSTKN